MQERLLDDRLEPTGAMRAGGLPLNRIDVAELPGCGALHEIDPAHGESKGRSSPA